MVQVPIKKFFVVIAVLGAALVFASCYSYPIKAENYTKNIVYWDESLPREESVELAFMADHLTVTSYNGIAVDWGKKPLVFLPPGPTVFTVKIDADVGYTHYSGESIFAWDFKAGDRYSLQVGERAIDSKAVAGVVLWNMEVKMKYADMEFFPFPVPEKTVLE
jgi:hypothetical protein